ncbi:unnamed protein product [Strongylus vulgaris]|uniref:Uncharacterized protein n=1 Tax=Strongylus vulgaris TaxID=40348 RepID=A0A3P7J3X2_STRVU|nr:unnamed protein product [Strongylus vulgaris]
MYYLPNLPFFSRLFKERTRGGNLQLEFAQTHTITLKKSKFGGGTRQVTFHVSGLSQEAELKTAGKTLHITIGQGLPNTTREFLPNGMVKVEDILLGKGPALERPSTGYQRRVDKLRVSTRKTPLRNAPAPLPHAEPITNNHGMTNEVGDDFLDFFF